MKKVLIITYYWPPSGGAGVQRWLKFVKYLRTYGWEPVVYTAENPEAPSLDYSLAKDIPEGLEVIRKPIWEPYSFYRKFVGMKKEDKISAGFLSESKQPGFTQKVAVWLRGNLFIPDARRFWISPSITFLTNYIRHNAIDAIISTGPPHTTHMIALGIKKRLGIPWLADFRDPWTEIDFYTDLKLTRIADKIHHKMELRVLKSADSVVIISKSMAESFKKIYGRAYDIVTNGFDPEDTAIGGILQDKEFSLAHIGSMVKTRNPGLLWKVLRSLCDADSDFDRDLEIKLVGKVDFTVIESIKKYGLEKHLNKIEYLDHSAVIRVQQESQVLLLMINNTPNVKMILPGKFFEYLAAGRPILCIGAEGDASEILQETGTGLFSSFEDEAALKSNIMTYYAAFSNGTLNVTSKGIERFSREKLTGEITGILDRMLGSTEV